MANKDTPKTSTKPARWSQNRASITFELVQALSPTEAKAETMSTTFGHEPVDYASIRDNTEELIVRISNELTDNLTEKAMQIFLQRLVASFVNGAYGAAKFYGQKKSEALAIYVPVLNDERSEDREGVYGFETKGQRTASFAAQMGLQAYALMAAAHGACSAFEHITGDIWKPHEQTATVATNPSQQATAAMIAALAD
ncbi:MAG: hypothetical protein ACRDL5_02950 [Solirubrobacteraceae bacterium]